MANKDLRSIQLGTYRREGIIALPRDNARGADGHYLAVDPRLGGKANATRNTSTARRAREPWRLTTSGRRSLEAEGRRIAFNARWPKRASAAPSFAEKSGILLRAIGGIGGRLV